MARGRGFRSHDRPQVMSPSTHAFVPESHVSMQPCARNSCSSSADCPTRHWAARKAIRALRVVSYRPARSAQYLYIFKAVVVYTNSRCFPPCPVTLSPPLPLVFYGLLVPRGSKTACTRPPNAATTSSRGHDTPKSLKPPRTASGTWQGSRRPWD